LWLVATRPTTPGAWEALVLDHVQWRTPETSIRLTDGAELRQPFTVGVAARTAMHVAASPWRGRCDRAFAIHALAAGSSEPGASLVDGRVDCGRDITNGFAELALPRDRIARGRYALSLRADAGMLDFPVARADGTGFDPVSYRHGGGWERREHVLAIRGVVRVVDEH
jgi:hypothetical protein